ncbi:MAG: S66 peptidase family protein [Patescibacteria group bacterium]|nr:LD-carboxypeptidase [Patescibacteria group bacterium]
MEIVFPSKLKKGDTIAVIAPSRSMKIISEETRRIANERFDELGLKLILGKHVEERDEFHSTSVEARVDDLHWAFSDPDIQGIITVIGGFNSNQLLKHIDWEIIKNNPKVFCGFSDITTLNNAIYAKTGLVNYSGPHYSTFGQKSEFDYTLDYFLKCLMNDQPFEIEPSKQWTDDEWYRNQENRNPIENEGYLVINEGEASGTLVGGNIRLFTLLKGTQYFPSIEGSILFLEDDKKTVLHHFDMELQALMHTDEFRGVKGLVIGRFQKESNAKNELVLKMIQRKEELKNIPVIANADFGHTEPKFTFPVGGEIEITAEESKVKLKILEH